MATCVRDLRNLPKGCKFISFYVWLKLKTLGETARIDALGHFPPPQHVPCRSTLLILDLWDVGLQVQDLPKEARCIWARPWSRL